jgi:hypothetical protein
MEELGQWFNAVYKPSQPPPPSNRAGLVSACIDVGVSGGGPVGWILQSETGGELRVEGQ